ncbi:MAG: MATE family efflux transporter, partial [Oscillospiraceae bacterium]|nr:MATE family efflux transporter [Oscillospiraceae bacterium]
NLLQQFYNTVDSIIVGQFVSESAFAGVSTCSSLTFFYLGIAIGLSIGVGVVVSQYFGAGMDDELPQAFGAVRAAAHTLYARSRIADSLAFFELINILFPPDLLNHIAVQPRPRKISYSFDPNNGMEPENFVSD